MARVLVEHGADVNRRDSEGKTVMMVRRCLLKLEGITDTSVLSSHCQAPGLLMCVPPLTSHVHIENMVKRSGGQPGPVKHKEKS